MSELQAETQSENTLERIVCSLDYARGHRDIEALKALVSEADSLGFHETAGEIKATLESFERV